MLIDTSLFTINGGKQKKQADCVMFIFRGRLKE